MKFKLKHLILKDQPEIEVTEETAPDWLTSKKSVPGSTMDQRWFWEQKILTIQVGEHADSDFHRITRVE